VRKNRVILFIIILVLIETVAVFIVLKPYIFRKHHEPARILRLGIVIQISRQYAEKEWSLFLEKFEKETSFRIVPYYAESYENAIKGFKSGSLDLLYINAGIFLDLKKQYNVVPLAFHKYSERENKMNRSVIISDGSTEFIRDSIGKKITFVDKYSLDGYKIPRKYLEKKLREPPEKWFSNISFAHTSRKALEMLKKGDTDISALNLLYFDEIVKNRPELKGEYKIIWMSSRLPEPLICAKRENPYLKSVFLRKIKKILQNDVLRRKVDYNRHSMEFELTGFSYMKKLEKLEKELEKD
jgi:phosphate/phosphite/phosphonate ABC transporter binding protein